MTQSDCTHLEQRALEAQEQSTGHFSCCLIDATTRALWHFQGHTVWPAASIIKVPILVELYARFDAGDLDLDERVCLEDASRVGGAGVLFELHTGLELTLRDLGILMTVISDNTASNMLIERLGFDAINDRIQVIGMADTVLGRKFMTDPDALDAKNFITACDMARCLARLHWGELLGPRSTEDVVGILKRQQYREKIPLFLPEDVPVGNKTGEISGTRHDAALVLLPGAPYILCCMTRGVRDVLAADRAIADLSLYIYEWMNNHRKRTG